VIPPDEPEEEEDELGRLDENPESSLDEGEVKE
jgi:hypothetical protein